MSESGSTASHAGGASRPLALIADDQDEVRQLVAEVLADAGFDTVAARDGLELIELAARHQPQLIVADVMMPKMDGYTAVARLRGQPATAGSPSSCSPAAWTPRTLSSARAWASPRT